MTKMLIGRAVVEQALEALELFVPKEDYENRPVGNVMDALRAALAEPVEEPVQEPDRAAFERHAESLGYSVDPDIREGREGGYWSSHTQLMWLTWQAALAEPVQEPVAKCVDDICSEHLGRVEAFDHLPRGTLLYAILPQRKPLSEVDLRALYDRHAACQEEGPEISGWWDFARAVERAHGIGVQP